ncbi:MAG: hypothetical protein R2747_10910 [Pyrinomonadaceae bacterium]
MFDDNFQKRGFQSGHPVDNLLLSVNISFLSGVYIGFKGIGQKLENQINHPKSSQKNILKKKLLIFNLDFLERKNKPTSSKQERLTGKQPACQ